MLLLQTLLLSLISVAAADVSCASEIPAATCSALAAGAPLEPRHATLNCNKITGVLGVLKGLAGPATSFCSSYLGVPTATTVRTTVTPAPSTESVVVTVTSTTTVFAFVQKRSIEAPPAAPVHDLKARTVPKALARFGAREISAACSCLNISPRATVTQTETAPTPIITEPSTLTLISTVTTCAPLGGPCNCNDPGACCNRVCSCNDFQGRPVSTCL